MTDDNDRALDSATLRLGDRVDVQGNERIRYIGYVEDTMPQLNIVWIREMRTGERRMLSTNECHIYPAEP